MDNPELILQSLEHFPKLKDDEDYNIPVELEEYIHYVAKTGDPVFQWTLIKPLFREKIIKVITDFFESNPGEIPDYPNVAKFNYDNMKETLLERIDWFKGAPFTIQRISELLVNPTKEYNRVDKYMRALEKNIYVVSTREPGMPQPVEENNSSFEESFIMNGNDFELKTETNEDNVIKEEGEEEDTNSTALLMLKKCSNGEGDDPYFNIEVDVTNTTAEDAEDDIKLDSGDISVQDEVPSTSEISNMNENKSGQTRKLEEEEEDQVENKTKRFKMDDESETNEVGHIGKGNEGNTEEVDPVENVNVDTLQEAEESLNVLESDSKDDTDFKNVEKKNTSPIKDMFDVNERNVNNNENVEKVNEQVLEASISNKTDIAVSRDNDKIDDDKEIVKDNIVTEALSSQESECTTNKETTAESTGPTSDEMNIEPMPETIISQSEESSSTRSIEDTNTESKVNDEMELEEAVNNKIESFDINKSESSLDMSESDSMVISQESASSFEENADKSIDKIDMVVSESSDMDLSDSTDKK